MAQSDVYGWITAIATGATAVLTGTGGVAAWLALRRDKRRELPVIERSLTWRDDYLLLSLTVRNRLPESIKLLSVEVRSPKGFTVTDSYGEARNVYGERGPPTKGGSRFFAVAHGSVAPVGAERTQISNGDVGYFSFALWPPTSRSGRATIVLRISSMADTIRDRRVTIRTMIPAKPSKQTDEKANSAA